MATKILKTRSFHVKIPSRQEDPVNVPSHVGLGEGIEIGSGSRSDHVRHFFCLFSVFKIRCPAYPVSGEFGKPTCSSQRQKIGVRISIDETYVKKRTPCIPVAKAERLTQPYRLPAIDGICRNGGIRALATKDLAPSDDPFSVRRNSVKIQYRLRDNFLATCPVLPLTIQEIQPFFR